ncbi:hypothetical protein GCM10010389_49120 [Streptomyces echinoruber]|uniref:Uncharacterized protein n=1 Tax=Streptomyces echinoruber TaxID=68898 RepID=A0A918RN18_9ACTN|nr:hypothetical protein GCM10010389_49120 [Streptomyces echinoruber]
MVAGVVTASGPSWTVPFTGLSPWRERMGGMPRTRGCGPRPSWMPAAEMPRDRDRDRGRGRGRPLRSVIRRIFDPLLPRSVGFGPVSGPLVPPSG